MGRPALTKAQERALEVIRGLVAGGQSPALREIAAALKMSSPAAHDVIGALETKGYLWSGRTESSRFSISLNDSDPYVPPTRILGGFYEDGHVSWLRDSSIALVFLLEGNHPGKSIFLYAESTQPEVPVHQGDLMLFDPTGDVEYGDLVLIVEWNRAGPSIAQLKRHRPPAKVVRFGGLELEGRATRASKHVGDFVDRAPRGLSWLRSRRWEPDDLRPMWLAPWPAASRAAAVISGTPWGKASAVVRYPMRPTRDAPLLDP